MCKGDTQAVLGLFRHRGSLNPVIYSFDHETATWSSMQPHIRLRWDIVQIVLIRGHMLAVTASRTVLVRKMDHDQTEFVQVANSCRRLLQAGRHCFGLFEEDGEIALRRFDPNLNSMTHLGIRMADHFASCSRVDQNGNVLLYIAGEDFDFPVNPSCFSSSSYSTVVHTRDAFGPGLLLVHVNCLGYVYDLEMHDILLGPGCHLDFSANIVSLWMKGLREVVKLNATTLAVEWVEFVAHKPPLSTNLIYPDEAILFSVENTSFLFHRKPVADCGEDIRELNTYQLLLNNDDNRRCWNHVSSFLRVDLLSVFDGKFASQCERL